MVDVSCKYVGSFPLPFWGQGMLLPSIILMSFIGLSGVNVEVKYLEFVCSSCMT